MAATVEGLFKIIDGASGPMQRMERQAKKTDASIESLGERLDNVGSAKQIKQIDNIGSTLDKVATQTKADTKGMKDGIEGIGKSSEDTSAKGTVAWKEFAKQVSSATKGMESDSAKLKAALNLVDGKYNIDITGKGDLIESTQLARQLKRELDAVQRQQTKTALGSLGLRAATGGGGGKGTSILQRLGGAATPFGALPTVAVAATGAVVELGGAVGALAGSLGAAALGAGALAIGGAGIAGTGLAGVVAIAIPAISAIKSLGKAQTAYNLAISTYGKNSTQAATAAKKLLAVEKTSPNMHGFNPMQLKGLSTDWKKQTKAGQGDFFGMLEFGIKRARDLMPTFAASANQSMKAARGGVELFLKRLDGPGFKNFIRVMTNSFSKDVKPMASTLANIGQVFGRIADAAAPRIDEMVKSLSEATKGWVEGTANAKEMSEKVGSLIGQTKDWGRMLWALGGLIKDTFGAGAGQGQDMVKSMTHHFKEWDHWIKNNQKSVKGFFRQAKEGAGTFFEMIGSFVPTLVTFYKAFRPISTVIEKAVTALANMKIGNISALTGVLAAVTVGKMGGKLFGGGVGTIMGSRGPAAPGSLINPIAVVGGGSGGVPIPGGPGGKTGTAGKIESFIQRHPYAAASIPLALGAGAGYGVTKLFDKGGPLHNPAYDGPSIGQRFHEGVSPEVVRKRQAEHASFGNMTGATIQAPGQKKLPTGSGTGFVPGIGTVTGLRGKLLKEGQEGGAHFMQGLVEGISQGRIKVIRPLEQMEQTIKSINSHLYTSSSKEWQNISQAMSSQAEKAKEEVSAAFTAMQKEAMASLIAMGFNNSSAAAIIKGKESGKIGANADPASLKVGHHLDPHYTNKGKGRARGGRVPGFGNQDNTYMGSGTWGAAGELVVNKHTEADVNSVLGRYGTSLGGMVGKEGRPHSELHYARGGRGTGSGIESVGQYASGRGLSVSGGPGFGGIPTSGHAAGSLHYSGLAYDVSGAPNQMWAFRKAAEARYLQHNLNELFYDPYPYYIDQGGKVPGSIGGHSDHVHIGFYPGGPSGASAVKGLMGAAGGGFKHVNAPHSKLGGAPGAMANSAMGAYAAGLNKKIGAHAGMGATRSRGPGGLGGLSGTLGFGQLVALARRAGMANPTLMAHIAEAESGGQAGVVNSIGATGLWQIYNHPELVSKYGSMTNPWHNAEAAADLLKTQGLGAWAASQGSWGQYASRGGRLSSPGFAGWFGKGGSVTASSPTLLGIGDGPGTEVATVKPKTGGSAGAVSGISIGHMSIAYHRPGDAKHAIKKEVNEAFQELANELELTPNTDDAEVLG